jgi:hypothetical protein
MRIGHIKDFSEIYTSIEHSGMVFALSLSLSLSLIHNNTHRHLFPNIRDRATGGIPHTLRLRRIVCGPVSFQGIDLSKKKHCVPMRVFSRDFLVKINDRRFIYDAK